MKNALTCDTALNIQESATILLKRWGIIYQYLCSFHCRNSLRLKWVMMSIVLFTSFLSTGVNSMNMCTEKYFLVFFIINELFFQTLFYS
jgi:hypothetical protein